MIVKHGVTRIVFLIGKLAIKIPNGSYSWQHFVLGMLANAQERKFSHANHNFCPTLYCSALGLLLVMKRARPVGILCLFDEDSLESLFGNYSGMVENKLDSFGEIDGKLVAIDYGSPHKCTHG